MAIVDTTLAAPTYNQERYRDGGDGKGGADVSAAANGIGFSTTELAALHRAYAGSARGAVLILVRAERRLLTLHLPSVTSEAVLVRALRPIIARARATQVDGWMLARRARLQRSESGALVVHPIAHIVPIVLLAQERVRRADNTLHTNQIVSLLVPADQITFYESSQIEVADQVISLLDEMTVNASCCHQ